MSVFETPGKKLLASFPTCPTATPTVPRHGRILPSTVCETSIKAGPTTEQAWEDHTASHKVPNNTTFLTTACTNHGHQLEISKLKLGRGPGRSGGGPWSATVLRVGG